MAVEKFEPDNFAKNLVQQAGDYVPADVSSSDKEFLLNILYKFCTMAGSAIIQDKSLNFNNQQAMIITQFIGEWTFHKTLDLIRSDVPKEFWEQPVLQKIAFSVFEVGKQTQINNYDQDKTAQVIENEVITAFKTALDELYNSKAITDAQYKSALSQSNIDNMNQTQETQQQGHNQHNVKLATMAVVLKNLPASTVESILKNLSENDAKIIQSFMQIPDLEKQIEPNDAQRFIFQLKNIVPDSNSVKNHNFLELTKLVNKSIKIEMQNLFKDERPKFQELIENCLKNNVDKLNDTKLTSKVTSIIINYIKEKSGTI